MPISLASNATAPRIFSTSAASARSASGNPSGTFSRTSVGLALVKIALQDKLRRHLIANALVRARSYSGVGQRLRRGVRRETLVDKLGQDAEASFELLGEAAGTRGQCVRRAVGMNRQPYHQQRGMPFAD